MSKGCEIELPKNYAVWVLQGGDKNRTKSIGVDEAKDVKLIAAQKSNKILVWNYDKEGELDNPIRRALQWTQICDAIAVSDNDDDKENLEKT